MPEGKQLIFDLVRGMTVGVLMFDPTKRLFLANPIIRTITGVYREDATFGDFIKLFSKEEELRKPEGGRVELADAVDDALQEGKAFKFENVGFKNKFFEIVVTPIRGEDRNINGGAIIFHDITKIKEIDDLKTEFVTVASHQLRTPLTAIRLYSEMLLKHDIGKINQTQKEYLEAIDKSTERMIVLVNDLLNISRIESQTFKILPMPTKIDNFVKDLVEESELIAKSKKCELVFEKTIKGSPEIPLDKKLMRQVILNLISNAVRYSNNHSGKIMVRLDERSTNFIISVEDSGIGIPEKVQGRIFEKFFRAGNAISREPEGTGMGMYIAKTLIEAAGGKIWFKSVEGGGTTFFIMIPKGGMKKRGGTKELA